MIRFKVIGIPASQGSKRHVGRGIMVESSQKLKPWRQAMSAAAQEWFPVTTSQPIHLQIEFLFLRPKAHYRADGTLRPSAPVQKVTTPDLDKLVRTVDAFTGVIWDNDSQIVMITASKRFTDPTEQPGALVGIELLPVA